MIFSFNFPNILQFIKPLFKEFRAIISFAVLQQVGVFFVAAMILFPCNSKADFPEPREIGPIIVDSSFMFGIFTLEPLSFAWDQSGIQGPEEIIFTEVFYPGGVHDFSEFGGSLDDNFVPVSSDSKRVQYPDDDQAGKEGNDAAKKPSFLGIQLKNPFNQEPGDSLFFWVMQLIIYGYAFNAHKLWPLKQLYDRGFLPPRKYIPGANAAVEPRASQV